MDNFSAGIRRPTRWKRTLFALGLAATMPLAFVSAGNRASAQAAGGTSAPVLTMGILPPEQVEKLLPPAVYFRGQSALLQLRNAAAYRAGDGAITWASLVDTSGYSTGVRERYQFYLVTETPLRAGATTIAAGAYGGGFLSDGTFILLDVGNHELARIPTTTDADMRRPRPLQMVLDGNGVRLYLGREYVLLVRQ